MVAGLATALGPTFGELWKTFEKPVLKFAGSTESIERSTSVGVISEAIAGMDDAVTQYTSTLLKALLHRLSDEDPETKSNAAFAMGLLCEKSDADAEITRAYNTILGKLEPMLHQETARMVDNAAGCVSRMIVAHPDSVPIDEVLPVLVGLLPLKGDYDENEAVWLMVVKLCEYPREESDVVLTGGSRPEQQRHDAVSDCQSDSRPGRSAVAAQGAADG